MLKIGLYSITEPVFLAPMAGITDPPFREICQSMGAGLATAEMITCDTKLWHTQKSSKRITHQKSKPGQQQLWSVQIVGHDPMMMAAAASQCQGMGADLIDINFGCPAKKVCNKAAGSALLRDKPQVRSIIESVVQAVTIPVTIKIRTGWSTQCRNAVTIAKLAEDLGVSAIAIHGRTRECRFQGKAEYDTIATVKNAVSIPVIANGDIDSAGKAKFVMDYTGADAVMLGRAVRGRPWLFREIIHFLKHQKLLPQPAISEIRDIMLNHVSKLHSFYGDFMGVRIARKHVGWYLSAVSCKKSFRGAFNQLDTSLAQLSFLEDCLDNSCEHLINRKEGHAA